MKKYNVIILEVAQIELEEIARVHLELVGVESAKNIVNKIMGKIERLETYPLSSSLIKDKVLGSMGYRILVCDKYLCIYRLLGDEVYIYHIVHGAINYPTLLKNSKF